MSDWNVTRIKYCSIFLSITSIVYILINAAMAANITIKNEWQINETIIAASSFYYDKNKKLYKFCKDATLSNNLFKITADEIFLDDISQVYEARSLNSVAFYLSNQLGYDLINGICSDLKYNNVTNTLYLSGKVKIIYLDLHIATNKEINIVK
ncbi:hypothetical protein [Candidatus Kinetoplastidibacterium crithidiae]|uniref:Uncharacterized protein n=1 Tax=Candidatus Kinetoplastidibacterium crithidiae TCC036E TaxID=1208918 RepID=M1LV08_9PROT|nr:hypothetical protein [Candidatus Kinetoplastibacterium crithidii]AFZ82931.1 hypothetical protein CKCE_0508 [Candidatus Kinetoplastibacterium crithidii (ex Angomonas deanei ATCC 30255)]AGF47931.1 hypothetical protein CDEE_0089 [Candidatus Kinetoplastibacterium crithidii TCC036E]